MGRPRRHSLTIEKPALTLALLSRGRIVSEWTGYPESAGIHRSKTGKDRKKAKEAYKKKGEGIRTAELNRRDQVTAANSWPSFHRKTGAKVDNQAAAPTALGTPTMHRAKTAQERVWMERCGQRRPGSNARNPQQGKRKQKEHTEKENHA